MEDDMDSPPPLPAVVDLFHEYQPDEVYVRGHFMPETDAGALALKAAGLHIDGLCNFRRDYVRPRLGIVARRWARWGFAPPGFDYGEGRCLYFTDHPGRGAFPVTVVADLDEADRRAELLQHYARLDAAVTGFVRAWLPEATDVRPWGRPATGVFFRLPGLAGACGWMVHDPGSVMVEQRDLDTFCDRYQGRQRPPVPEILAAQGLRP
jgi:hypothetical protein